MRRSSWLGFLILGSTAALAACGGDDTSGSGGSGTTATGGGGATTGATTTSSTSMTTTTTVSTGGTTTGAGGEGGQLPLLNGCNIETAEDMTGADVDIDFPGNDNAYSPACVILSLAFRATFAGGDFSEHPLVGGTVVDGVATEDESSPIYSQAGDPFVKPYFAVLGTFPYYCQYHYGTGMMGVIYVVP